MHNCRNNQPLPHHQEEKPPLFALGRVVATPSALRHCAEKNINPADLIARHQVGDWGALDEGDLQANADALVKGGRLLSVYIVAEVRLYILTEYNRSATTLLKASEY